MSASEALKPVAFNTTLTTPDDEYTVTLPVGTKHFSCQCRTSFPVRMAFKTGLANGASPTGPYATIKAGASYTSPEKVGWSRTDSVETAPVLYFSADEAAVVVEVVAWKDVR